ncbi:rab family gtpase [Pelomyxa schiedti]|nr:rab family gtpase [Pelomyxa schiedti]
MMLLGNRRGTTGTSAATNVGVIDSGFAESIVRNIYDLKTLSALDRVNKLFHSFASVKLKALHTESCVKWVTERPPLPKPGIWVGITGIKVCVIGDTESGKTCIVDRLAGRDLREVHEPTKGACQVTAIAPLDGGTVKLELLDTGGQEKFRSLWPMFYRKSAAILLVYDVSNSASLIALKTVLTEIRILDATIKFLLCGNKADTKGTTALLSAHCGETVTYSQGLEFAQSSHCDGFLEVSAKTMKNIPELLTALGHLALEHIATRNNPDTESGKIPKGSRRPLGGHSTVYAPPCMLM